MNIPAVPPRCRPCYPAFTLLEVVVSVAILGIALAASMRSFVVSLEAARRAEIINTGTMLAQDLIEELQISPPGEGKFDGSFAPDNPRYSYALVIEKEEVPYKGLRGARKRESFKPLEKIHLVVKYEDERRSLRAIELDSAVLGLQRFSNLALKEYRLFELY